MHCSGRWHTCSYKNYTMNASSAKEATKNLVYVDIVSVLSCLSMTLRAARHWTLTPSTPMRVDSSLVSKTEKTTITLSLGHSICTTESSMTHCTFSVDRP